MDPQVESEAINIVATEGKVKYREFLKRNGALDFLSSEDVATIRRPNFDIRTVCERIKSRPEGVLASVVQQFASTSVAQSSSLRALTRRAEGSDSADVMEGVSSDVLFSPPTGDTTIPSTLLDMINKAQKEVLVAMFIFTDPCIFEALYTKAKSGVTVKMVLDRSKVSLFNEMLSKNHAKFPAKPVNMYIGVIFGTGGNGLPVGYAHEKFMVVDSKCAFTGSYNFTWRAARVNRELAVFTTYVGGSTPPTLITKLQEQETCLIDVSTPYIWP